MASSKANTALALGIAGIIPIIGPILAIIAIVLGSQSMKAPEDKNIGTAALVVGIVTLVLTIPITLAAIGAIAYFGVLSPQHLTPGPVIIAIEPSTGEADELLVTIDGPTNRICTIWAGVETPDGTITHSIDPRTDPGAIQLSDGRQIAHIELEPGELSNARSAIISLTGGTECMIRFDEMTIDLH
ncbi:MAG: hypothetical protein ABIH41_03690 [Nanoarchaeota archaeon]